MKLLHYPCCWYTEYAHQGNLTAPSFQIQFHDNTSFACSTNPLNVSSDLPLPNSRAFYHFGGDGTSGVQVGSSRAAVVDGGGLLSLVSFTHLHRSAHAAMARTDCCWVSVNI